VSGSRTRLLTKQQVERAIYLDFEGRASSKRGAAAPDATFAGFTQEGKHSFVVLDERFKGAADAKGGSFEPLAEFAARLIDRAREEERIIIHWSSREAQVFEDQELPLGHAGFDLLGPTKKAMRHVFRDHREAQKELKRASSKTARKKVSVRRLYGQCVRCAEEHGREVPSSYGWGKVGQWIRDCEAQAGRAYSDCSPGVKKKWSKLLSHNRLDCRAMEILARQYAVARRP